MDVETRGAIKGLHERVDECDKHWVEIKAFMVKIDDRFEHGKVITAADCFMSRAECAQARRKPWHTIAVGAAITLINVTLFALWHWLTQHRGGS